MGAGDVMIHCGDMLNLACDSDAELARVDDWFGDQRFDAVLCTGGNHDWALQRRVETGAVAFANARYLQDAGWEYRGLKFYAAPWVPDLPRHAFHAPDRVLRRKWAEIPTGIDVLITHTPPAGILDVSSNGKSLGCPLLRDELARIRPRLHCFGHVHAGAGQTRIGDTLFVNASALVSRSSHVRGAVCVTLTPF